MPARLSVALFFLAVPLARRPAVGGRAAVQPLPLGVDDALRRPALRRDQARALPAGDQGGHRAARREVKAIAANAAPPTFANTIEALDASGRLLEKAGSVFSNMQSAETNERCRPSSEVAPLLAALRDDIRLNPALFARVKAVWEAARALKLDAGPGQLLEDTWKDFVRGGALLPTEEERFRAINGELSSLGIKFGDNLLHDTNGYRLVIEKRDGPDGPLRRVVAGGAEAAKAAGLAGKWVVHAAGAEHLAVPAVRRQSRAAAADLHRLHHPQRPRRRDRQQGDPRPHRRAAGGAGAAARVQDPRRLRARREHGEDARQGLRVAQPAVGAGEGDGGAGGRRPAGGHPRRTGRTFTLEPWDWRYYAEKVRQARFDLDEQALRPYFTLDNVRDGAFYVANRLYGITFTERPDCPSTTPRSRRSR